MLHPLLLLGLLLSPIQPRSPTVVPGPTAAIHLEVGKAPVVAGVVGVVLEVPLLLDLSARREANLAAITVRVTWDPADLEFTGPAAGDWVDDDGRAAMQVVNSGEANQGVLRLSAFTPGPTTRSFVLSRLRFVPRTPGRAQIAATVVTAGDAMAAQVPVATRGLTVESR